VLLLALYGMKVAVSQVELLVFRISLPTMMIHGHTQIKLKE
jgi:hypothetical protein